MDEDGWLYMGDIGLWLFGGCFKIIDRFFFKFEIILLF